MIKDKSILINNIYHMLAYAFQILNQKNYEDVAVESFDEMYDLLAAILAKGIGMQLKQGVYKPSGRIIGHAWQNQSVWND